MINAIQLQNENGESLYIPWQDLGTGYFVKEITGLDPVKANLAMSNYGSVDGAQYQYSRRDPRNIVIRLGFAPDWVTNTVESLRQGLYALFLPKAFVKFRAVLSSGLLLDVDGRIESFETPLFTDDPEVTISIMCPQPDFQEKDHEIVSGNTVTDSTMSNITYEGTVESGIKLTLFPNRTLTEFDIYHQSPSAALSTIEFAFSLLSGDVLEISTVSGNKGAWLTRTGNRASVLYGVSPTSQYFRLARGLNKLRVVAAGAAIPYEIDYVNKYGGI